MANSKSIGTAYEDQKIDGGTIDNTPIGGTTVSTGAFSTLSATGAASFDGSTRLGNAAADVVGFHDTSGTAQSAFISTQSINALSVSGVVGFTSSTSLSSLVGKVNSILAILAAKGIMAAS